MLRFATKLLLAVFLVVVLAAAQSIPPQKSIPAIAKAANGAVVSIVMSDKNGNPIAQGSGFIVSKDGVIVTNYHVIAEGTSAVVKLPDGAFYLVDGVLEFDKARDIAVIKAHGEHFRTLTLGDSDHVQVGQEVVAIGNPLSLESTVSNGIVSSVRSIDEKGGKYLQITAPISPGSSGGPLFNMAGQVIGVTTMYLKGGENLNFAIPINAAKNLLLVQRAKLLGFPNVSVSPDTTPSSEVQQASEPTITSPQFKYYQQMLAAKDQSILGQGTQYACFLDEPTAQWFWTVSATVGIRNGMDVAYRIFDSGVPENGVYLFDGYISPDSTPDSFDALLPGNEGTESMMSNRFLTVMDDDSEMPADEKSRSEIEKSGYAEWTNETVSIILPNANDKKIDREIDRATGRFSISVGDDSTTINGTCVKIPGAKTPEEQFRDHRR